MKHAGRLAIVLIALSVLCTALPMANEEDLVALDSVEQLQTQQEPHILKIAPKQPEATMPEQQQQQQRPGVFDTIVEELRAAGVHTSEKKPLHTLSYKELTRLLALWHMSLGRNYYEANENRAPPAHNDEDDDVDDSS